jgi:hypothetical protein
MLSPDLLRERQLQALRIRAVNRDRQAVEVARVYAAYRHLQENVHFNIILDYWIDRLMLRPLTSEQAVGQHNFLVQILEDLANAQGTPLPTVPGAVSVRSQLG